LGGQGLSYRWVQESGTRSLSPAIHSDHGIYSTCGDDSLVFQLSVSDGISATSDDVKIFLNNAPPEIHQIVLTPGFANAGYVCRGPPDYELLEKRVIKVGALIREYRGPTGQPDGVATALGAMRFDLSAIPPGSQVTSAVLELTGAEAGTDFGSNMS